MPIYFIAGGDLSGTPVEQTVAKIKGVEISGDAAAGKVLTASSETVCSWEDDDDGDFVAGGDLTGTPIDQTVAKINGGTAPSNPVIGDIGKVITVIAAGTYGLANIPPSPPLIPPAVAISISGEPGFGTINWLAGNVFYGSLTAGTNTLSFSNVVNGKAIVVRLTSGGVSAVLWPGAVKWAFGVEPVQTATGTDVYTLVSDGIFIYGSVVQAMS